MSRTWCTEEVRCCCDWGGIFLDSVVEVGDVVPCARPGLSTAGEKRLGFQVMSIDSKKRNDFGKLLKYSDR